MPLHEDGQGNPAATAERVAVNTADAYLANQIRTLALAFKTRKRRKNELLDKGDVQTRRLVYRTKTAEAALKKARELSRTSCYDVYITTPEGRDDHPSEFGDLPRTLPSAGAPENYLPDKLIPISRAPR